MIILDRTSSVNAAGQKALLKNIARVTITVALTEIQQPDNQRSLRIWRKKIQSPQRTIHDVIS